MWFCWSGLIWSYNGGAALLNGFGLNYIVVTSMFNKTKVIIA